MNGSSNKMKWSKFSKFLKNIHCRYVRATLQHLTDNLITRFIVFLLILIDSVIALVDFLLSIQEAHHLPNYVLNSASLCIAAFFLFECLLRLLARGYDINSIEVFSIMFPHYEINTHLYVLLIRSHQN